MQVLLLSQSEAQHCAPWPIPRHLHEDGEPDQRILSGQADQRDLPGSAARGCEVEGEIRKISAYLDPRR